MAEGETCSENLEDKKLTESGNEASVEYPEKALTREEASECLTHVGPTYRQVNNDVTYIYPAYAYIAMAVKYRNVTDISAIPYFTHVIYLDLSGNRLTNESLKVLVNMPQLIALIVDANLVDSAAVPTMPQLELLTFRNNRIKTCEVNLQPNLMYFHLCHNNIKCINPYLWSSSSLPFLKDLGLRGNGLKTTLGIQFPNLVSLYLGENNITALEGLEVLISLKFLHLRNNPLKSLDGFSKANRKLFYLNLRGCKIKRKSEINKLQVLPKLERLVLKENPIADTDNFRIKVIAALPRLKRIDKMEVKLDERETAKEMINEEEEIEELEGEDSNEMAQNV